MKTFETPEQNRAYMEGFLSGRSERANGLDWAKARLAVDEAVRIHKRIVDDLQQRITELETENFNLKMALRTQIPETVTITKTVRYL